MKFTVKFNGFSEYPELKVKECGCTIESGPLTKEERYNVAKSMLEAVWELGPSQTNECELWLGRLMHEIGIVAVEEEEASRE